MQCYCSSQEIRQRDVKQRQRLTSFPSASSLLAFTLMDLFPQSRMFQVVLCRRVGRGAGGGWKGGSRTQLQLSTAEQKNQARATADQNQLLGLLVGPSLSRCRPRLQELLGVSGVG